LDPLEIICLHEELYAWQPLTSTTTRSCCDIRLFCSNAFFMNLRCSAYLAGLVQVIEWPFEDGALQALVRDYKATVAYKFDRTVSQHSSYVYKDGALQALVRPYKATVAHALKRHCRKAALPPACIHTAALPPVCSLAFIAALPPACIHTATLPP
jgi:hypothetical protein